MELYNCVILCGVIKTTKIRLYLNFDSLELFKESKILCAFYVTIKRNTGIRVLLIFVVVLAGGNLILRILN